MACTDSPTEPSTDPPGLITIPVGVVTVCHLGQTITVPEPSFAGHLVHGDALVPPPGLVSWLPGDDNASDIVGTNNGTLQDGATFGTGLVGQAFSFDGNSSVTLTDPPNVPNQGSLTYDLWINVASFTNGLIGNGLGSYFVDRTAETQPLVSLKAVADQFAFQVRYNDNSGLGGPIGLCSSQL